jgi:hypothetical protein
VIINILQILQNSVGHSDQLIARHARNLCGIVQEHTLSFNYKETEEILKKELIKDGKTNDTDADASFYYQTYETLYQFVESVQKENKHELAQVLYPVFLHLYLELVNKNLNKLGKSPIPQTFRYSFMGVLLGSSLPVLPVGLIKKRPI